MAQMHWRSEGPVRELIGARVLTDGEREKERERDWMERNAVKRMLAR